MAPRERFWPTYPEGGGEREKGRWPDTVAVLLGRAVPRPPDRCLCLDTQGAAQHYPLGSPERSAVRCGPSGLLQAWTPVEGS